MSSKKIILGILILLIVFLLYFILQFKKTYNQSTTPELDTIINSVLNNQKKYYTLVPKDKIDKLIITLKNLKNTQEVRYNALSDIIYYFVDAYGRTNNPQIRNFIIGLGPEAKIIFPKNYKDYTFNIPCADATCGEKISPEIEKIIKELMGLKTEKKYINTILINIKIASYIPFGTKDQQLDKISSFSLSYNQMLSLGIPQASLSAQSLKLYIKNKYNQEL